jgi:hypothetical protein
VSEAYRVGWSDAIAKANGAMKFRRQGALDLLYAFRTLLERRGIELSREESEIMLIMGSVFKVSSVEDLPSGLWVIDQEPRKNK